jgi:small-conductance mechanosensitive channel
MNTNKITTELEDMKISVKMKLSALWATVMFCYIYGDILAFHQPGVIADIMAGKMGPFTVTQGSLLAAALFMAIPGIMVFLSLVLKPKVNRRTNIALGVFYIITNSLSAFSSSWAFFIVYGVIEGALNALIVWYAWKWPKQENAIDKKSNQ